MKRLLLLAVAVVLLVGCAGEEDATPTGTTDVRVYFLLDGKVWPVRRDVDRTADLLDASYQALLLGPTQEEQDLGLTTEVPADGTGELSDAARAQLVYTATQFSSSASASIGSETFTREDFENETPSVLVESPLPFDVVSTPLRVAGTANTFEANFEYELLDSDGNVVDETFVTATSGTGTRGTFLFTTAAVDDLATLVVFETSAEDGSRMREVEIPLMQAR